MGTLYERISELCRLKGVTPSRMCLDLGMSKSTVSDIKSGRKSGLASSSANKIANYLGVTVGYLLGNDEDGRVLEVVRDKLNQFIGHNPDACSGKRLDFLFTASDYDLSTVCFNLGIDQYYLDNWMQDNDLPPKPIVDKILGVFRLKPDDLFPAGELSEYSAEAQEWGATEKAPTVSGKRSLDSSEFGELTYAELELIRKFRRLDDRGQAAVLNVLNYEYDSLPGEKAHTAPKEA